jgi:putative oligomerization/nucleic acid binding protein/phospholipase D-like protein
LLTLARLKVRQWHTRAPLTLALTAMAGGSGSLEGETAVNYPLLNLFWTIFEVFLWVVWFWILITVFIDIFRSSDLNGWGKALWFLFVLLIPLVGVLVYLIARGGEMHNRAARVVEQQDAAARSYIREAAAPDSSSTADQLAKLADLHDRGVITDQEFQQQKAKVLA